MSASVDLVLLGIGLGLASVAGVRAFVPLLVVALSIQLLLGTTPGWGVVGLLAGLSVLESALDKIGPIERVFNLIMIPFRAAAGAVVVPLAMDLELDAVPFLAVGAVVAGAVAVLKALTRPRSTRGGAGVSGAFLSFFEDVVAVVGAIVGIFVPLLPILFVAFLLFFFNRVRRRRGRKYEGLRILRD